MLIRVVGLVASIAAFSHAESLRVVNWNLANHPNNATDQAQLRTILGYASADRPIDVLAMAETDTASAPDTANVFGSVFGGTYASVVASADGGGDRTGFVYNTATLSLVSTSNLGVGTLTHPSLRARFRPVGTRGSDDFYLYAVHLQSGSSTQYKTMRVNEAAFLRADADTLGSANVIIAGDFNWQKADDVSVGVGAYRTLAAPGQGQTTDPINQVGNWHMNPAFQKYMTEDPGANVDDRFDMQLTSSELLDGRGLNYVPGSYRVAANDGTTTPGTVLASSPTLPANVVSAIGEFSDHLPVIADYQFPTFTLDGDADQDGGVSINDFNTLAANFGASVGKAWADGDFDNDSGVSINDFNLLAAGFARTAPAGSDLWAGLLSFAAAHDDLVAFEAATGVPEPTTMVLLAAGGFVTLRRRR